MTWEQFIDLPIDTKVCLRYPDPKSRRKKIPVEGIICEGGSRIAKRIRIISQHRIFSGLVQSVFQAGFSDYEITAAPRPSSRLEKKLCHSIQFYKSILKNFKAASVQSWSRECLLVTNLSIWKSEVENIIVSVPEISEGYSSYALQDLLIPCHDVNIAYSGVFISSTKSDIINSIKSPLAIINGPDAIKSWDRISSPNIIILLDHLEYDEAVENFLALLSDARTNRTVDVPEGIPENPPSGVEMMILDLD